MASAVNVGSINLPKMMRHLSHRSSQVRDLTFVRDAIKRKEVKTTKADSSSLSGPPVSFGYDQGAEPSTATITFTGDAVVNQTITIIATDGTSRTFTAKSSTNAGAGQFINTNGSNANASGLEDCITNAAGLQGKVNVSRNASVLTLTQVVTGAAGNTTITENLDNTTKVDFAGGLEGFEPINAGTDTAYHASSPELVLPGLTMLQSPIVSRRGRLEKTGHRISGACTFYAPSLDYIRSLDNFKDTKAFSELESYDKLYDVERIIQNPTDVSATQQTTTFSFGDATAGYEVDRVRFSIKTAGTLDYVQLSGNIAGNAATLKWNNTSGMALSSSAWITFDLPISKVEGGDMTSIYKDGVRNEFVAALTGSFDADKLYGDSNNELSSLIVQLSSSSAVELRDIYLYKEAEWRIESIKDYRDEYMEIAAVRVRGDRASRRRAYG